MTYLANLPRFLGFSSAAAAIIGDYRIHFESEYRYVSAGRNFFEASKPTTNCQSPVVKQEPIE